MRRSVLMATLAAALVAGCTQPGADSDEDPLFGLCPQWTQGPGGQTTGLHITLEAPVQERELGPAEAEHDGHAFDLYRIRLDQINATGRLELRAFDADGRQLAIRDFRGDAPHIEPMVVVGNADQGLEFEVFLSSVAHGSIPAPAPAKLGWTLRGGEADLQYGVTFHYKVCGADV